MSNDLLGQLLQKLPSKGEASQIVDSLIHRVTGGQGRSNVMESTTAAEVQRLARHELVGKFLSTCLGLGASVLVSYFGIKWLVNAMDPTREEKKEAQKRAVQLMKKIGVTNMKLSEYELCIASNLVDPQSLIMSWSDIGGMDAVIQELKESVILPFRQAELFARSSLLQPPKGVLLYGPPGCGKTMIAKAMAKAAGARFINLQVSSLVDKWYGESQKRAEAVFSLAFKLQPTIIFIDEIDSFLRSRTSSDHEATAMIKTQFMSFWDGLVTDHKCHIMIVGATNRPQDVDAAILRRMPSRYHVGLPSSLQRERILNIIVRDEQLADDVDLARLADDTEGYSGSDLRELCRSAAIYRVRELMQQDLLSESGEDSISSSDLTMKQANFTNALNNMKLTRNSNPLASLSPVDLD